MIGLIQRVTRADVRVDGEVVGAIYDAPKDSKPYTDGTKIPAAALGNKET